MGTQAYMAAVHPQGAYMEFEEQDAPLDGCSSVHPGNTGASGDGCIQPRKLLLWNCNITSKWAHTGSLPGRGGIWLWKNGRHLSQ